MKNARVSRKTCTIVYLRCRAYTGDGFFFFFFHNVVSRVVCIGARIGVHFIFNIKNLADRSLLIDKRRNSGQHIRRQISR